MRDWGILPTVLLLLVLSLLGLLTRACAYAWVFKLFGII